MADQLLLPADHIFLSDLIDERLSEKDTLIHRFFQIFSDLHRQFAKEIATFKKHHGALLDEAKAPAEQFM